MKLLKLCLIAKSTLIMWYSEHGFFVLKYFFESISLYIFKHLSILSLFSNTLNFALQFRTLQFRFYNSLSFQFLMWVDFIFIHFKGDTLFMIWILENIRWDLGKIPSGHELNQVVKWVWRFTSKGKRKNILYGENDAYCGIETHERKQK